MEIREFRALIRKSRLPEEAEKEAERELQRLSRMHVSSSEYVVASTYLDWLISLPWHEASKDVLDIKSARRILNQDHYGLEKPKKRILEFLAVRKLKEKLQRPDSVLHRSARHRQNLPGPVHRQSPGAGNSSGFP